MVLNIITINIIVILISWMIVIVDRFIKVNNVIVIVMIEIVASCLMAIIIVHN